MNLNEQLAGMVAPHSLLETAMRRLMESGFWDETRVNRDKGRFAPKGTAGQRDLFGDQLKPETPEPERFENLGGRQQNLFGKKGLPGQMSLFADAGVPDELVAKPAEIADYPKISEPLANIPVEQGPGGPADVAGVAKPAEQEKAEGKGMGTPFTVVLAREPSSDKQLQYMEDVLANASAKLGELESVAPLSVAVVRNRHQDSLSKPKTHFADRIISQYRDKDWLAEVYTVAERELRNKEEKSALMPLRQAAADAFRAIPARGHTP